MPKKKQKLEPVIIVSREGMQAVVTDLVANKLRFAKLKIKMETEKASVEKEYQTEFDELARLIQAAEGGLHVWSIKHKEDEFGKKKSIDLPSATFGFRTSPPKVEKTSGTWEEIVARLAAVVVTGIDPTTGAEIVVFRGEDYIRYGVASVDKDSILRDREIIPAEALQAAGIVIAQDELFYFDPKSEVLEASTQEAA